MTVGRERGQLLFKVGRMALGTLSFLVTEDDGLKLVAALGAKIFKNRHVRSDNQSSLRHSPAIMVKVVAKIIIDVAYQFQPSRGTIGARRIRRPVAASACE